MQLNGNIKVYMYISGNESTRVHNLHYGMTDAADAMLIDTIHET